MIYLPGPAEAQLPRRHLLGDGGARAHVSPGADGHRRHQGGVAADEGPFPDDGLVLVDPVVVAGYGAAADVDVAAGWWRRRDRSGGWP